MLHCQIRGRGTGNAGEWKALTQGTQGKKAEAAAPYLLRVSSRFFLSALRPNYRRFTITEFN
jgi:hypothetical protein